MNDVVKTSAMSVDLPDETVVSIVHHPRKMVGTSLDDLQHEDLPRRGKPLNFKPASILFKEQEQEFSRRDALHPKHPDHPKGFKWDEDGGYHIWWGGYDYWIEFKEFDLPLDLLKWVTHLGKKGWEGATSRRIARFVESVCNRKQWDMHSPRAHLKSRASSAYEERAKLTPQLRWAVLKRDGFKCRACGNGPEHGAMLHIDHIVAIAKGGTTVLPNLQALCSACNIGKGRS